MTIFATIQEGERKGELVPVLDVDPSINLRRVEAPRTRNVSGYGRKLPTGYMVRVFNRRWHRVYMAQYGNAGTAYIIHKGKAFRVDW